MAHLGVLCFVVITCLAIRQSESYYQNWYDQRLYFECPSKSQAISSINSVHHDKYEDRKFGFGCRDVPEVSSRRQCEFSSWWENSHDGLLAFQCRSNGYIVGMNSEHKNKHEDRIWKFRCCGFDDVHLYDCELSGWTNDFDGYQDYRVPTGKVIKGVISIHNNFYEDRRYMYNVCNVKRW